MVRGKSGRIVLEIDPSIKEKLYESLRLDGVTLKDWFLLRAIRYIHEKTQPSLFDTEYTGKPPPLSKKKKAGDEGGE
ncbi:MAG: hypothetical protein GTO08_01740 [Deltaproteobacteria bacterium]|nr:hypothetical protein [Deltaproteobacteria bacterium]